jgi:hypothetical protein
VAVSERKLAANRENAKKSSGPKTIPGKAHSRANAIRHGLFATDLFEDLLITREKPEEFQKLCDRLREQYQPVGVAEELEVERIRICWWRLKRAWHYENAEIIFASADIAARAHGVDIRQFMSDEHRNALPLLESAEKEIEASGAISPELKEKIFVGLPAFREIWSRVETFVMQRMEHVIADEIGVSPRILRKHLAKSPDWHSKTARAIALATTKLAIKSIETGIKQAFEAAKNSAYDLRAIPNTTALDNVLRYEASIQRELSRAYDRLERLQRQRKGEPIPPPLNLRLSR